MWRGTRFITSTCHTWLTLTTHDLHWSHMTYTCHMTYTHQNVTYTCHTWCTPAKHGLHLSHDLHLSHMSHDLHLPHLTYIYHRGLTFITHDLHILHMLKHMTYTWHMSLTLITHDLCLSHTTYIAWFSTLCQVLLDLLLWKMNFAAKNKYIVINHVEMFLHIAIHYVYNL